SRRRKPARARRDRVTWEPAETAAWGSVEDTARRTGLSGAVTVDLTDRVERDARWRSRHAAQVQRALANGDASAIKQLYVDMGSFHEESFADDVEGVPQLSLSGTAPVVTRLL